MFYDFEVWCFRGCLIVAGQKEKKVFPTDALDLTLGDWNLKTEEMLLFAVSALEGEKLP